MLPEPSQTGSQTGVRYGSPTEESHVLTNGRTERMDTAVLLETAVDAGARIKDSTSKTQLDTTRAVQGLRDIKATDHEETA